MSTNMRVTRNAAKRAAAEETKETVSREVSRNKRPALAVVSTSICNQENPHSQSSKSQAITRETSTVRGKSVAAGRKSSKKESSHQLKVHNSTASSSSLAIPTESEGNAIITQSSDDEEDTKGQDSTKYFAFHSNSNVHAAADAIASLERRTLQHLNISDSQLISAQAFSNSTNQGVSADDNVNDKSSWTCSLGYVDIDNDHGDPQMCSTYAVDIYQHLRMAELRKRIPVDFMQEKQVDITPSMRGILIDWLVEVAEEYKVVPDTLYLTCSYIDRFLANNNVPRNRLQLLGVTCMLIAAKYEEIYAPQVEEFCYITDNTYKRDDVIEMEKTILKDLNFELSTPTTKSFLRRFIRAAQMSSPNPCLELEFLGNFLAELTLLDHLFAKYLPSVVAASAVFLAEYTLDGTTHPWSKTLRHYTGYRPSDLQECVEEIYALQINKNNCQLPAVRDKYNQARFKNVASLTPPSEIPMYLFEDNLPSILNESTDKRMLL